MVFVEVKLCDPCLSALKWFVPCKALYKCSALLYFTPGYEERTKYAEPIKCKPVQTMFVSMLVYVQCVLPEMKR